MNLQSTCLTLALLTGALPRFFHIRATAQTVSASASGGASIAKSTLSESSLTVFDGTTLQVVTSTDIPSTQTATEHPSASVTGSLITTLATEGNPPVQPFPSLNITVSSPTLSPFQETGPFSNATDLPATTNTDAVTVPATTLTSLSTNTTILVVPQETSFTNVFTVVTLVSTDGGTVATTTTVESTFTGTAVSQSTIEVSQTVTQTVSSVIQGGSALPTATPPACSLSMACEGQNMFLPVDVHQPPANIQQRSGHPVPRLGIQDQGIPLETNKFYSNFFLGNQDFPAFVTPYSLTWSRGNGNAQSFGMAISHIESSQKVFGPPNNRIPNTPASYYINPLGIQSLILSASELQQQTVLTTDALQLFSANAHLSPTQGAPPVLTMPMVQGMAFITGLYTNAQCVVQSSVFFRSVSAVNTTTDGISKYKVTLEDGKIWVIYAFSDTGIAPNFQLVSSTMLRGIPSWSGTIQIAKLPSNDVEYVYDNAAGAYPTTGTIGGYAHNATGQYTLSWAKGGPKASNTTLLMCALPHHVQSFDNNTESKVTNLQLDTLTKGVATAVSADYWVMEEQLPVDMGFAPWKPSGQQGVQSTLSASTLSLVRNIAAVEASQNMSAQSYLNSMYYSGKALSKFATLVYTMNTFTNQQNLATSALAELKSAFAAFTENRQEFPLLYDTDWKGIVSSASYVTGDPGVDFGNSYYNDHHFHYGYFIHAAAIIGYMEPSWLTYNKDYVNALVRDTSNPSSLDQYFPVFRSFDWYSGHSWAKGLYDTGDGKDEESTSEDAMYAYGLKMWGKTTGDASMEARGNLMLATLARSLRNYFLMESDNMNQPPQFIGNKVTGILFENKADHVTYFGANFEYVQGIQMIPLMPFSTLTRTPQFVAEEWGTYFADSAVTPAWNVSGGWKGLLYANLANINPTASYNFFAQDNFDPSWIDGGATRTWYIVLAALSGAST